MDSQSRSLGKWKGKTKTGRGQLYKQRAVKTWDSYKSELTKVKSNFNYSRIIDALSFITHWIWENNWDFDMYKTIRK